jgi:CRP/FNR family cyclic AMP-dependent transcriptional regulator
MSEHVMEQTYETGDTVFRQGDESVSLYVLLEGSTAVVEDGVVLATIDEPGSIVGEMSALLQVPRTADLRAETKCRLQVVSNPEQWLRQNPDRCVDLARMLADRLHEMDLRFLEARRELTKKGLAVPGEEAELAPELQAFKGLLKVWRVRV